MPTNDIVRSHILITEAVEEAAENFVLSLKPYRCVTFIKEDFLIEDAKAVVAESYIAEADIKYIVLGGKSINVISQNSLLKVLEEPPRNIEFIIIVPSKSVLLPTVRSRLPMKSEKTIREIATLDIRLSQFDLDQLFRFVKAHERLKKHEAKTLLEALFYQATMREKMVLNARQLESFDSAYRLLELNGRFQVILVNVLMTFIADKPRAY